MTLIRKRIEVKGKKHQRPVVLHLKCEWMGLKSVGNKCNNFHKENRKLKKFKERLIISTVVTGN